MILKVPALAIPQPWASLHAKGLEWYPDRRRIRERGPLLIYSPLDFRTSFRYLCHQRPIWERLWGYDPTASEIAKLPRGKIVAACILDEITATFRVSNRIPRWVKKVGDYRRRWTYHFADVGPVPLQEARAELHVWRCPIDSDIILPWLKKAGYPPPEYGFPPRAPEASPCCVCGEMTYLLCRDCGPVEVAQRAVCGNVSCLLQHEKDYACAPWKTWSES